MLLQVLKCARGTPATHLCLYFLTLPSMLLRRVSEAREKISCKNSLFLAFFSCSLVWTSIHMDQIFRAPSGRRAFRRVPFKCEDFLKTGNQSFWCSSFLFKRFFFRGSKSLNSVRCWKLLLPLITSDILNSIFQTQPSRMVIKSVGWASSSSRQGIQCHYRQLTDWNLQFWSWGVKLA